MIAKLATVVTGAAASSFAVVPPRFSRRLRPVACRHLPVVTGAATSSLAAFPLPVAFPPAPARHPPRRDCSRVQRRSLWGGEGGVEGSGIRTLWRGEGGGEGSGGGPLWGGEENGEGSGGGTLWGEEGRGEGSGGGTPATTASAPAIAPALACPRLLQPISRTPSDPACHPAPSPVTFPSATAGLEEGRGGRECCSKGAAEIGGEVQGGWLIGGGDVEVSKRGRCGHPPTSSPHPPLTPPFVKGG
ncbi:unnamed protein product [Closterium sp. Naga37s-1]|nr:unnamed protein product [Closterium sp. Naga37s-1]